MTRNLQRKERISKLITRLLETDPNPTPEISILTPTWNTRTAWMEELALSILTQSCLDWEWCIVDDRSSDTAFHEVFAELERLPNVHILRSDISCGISGATNRALALATAPLACCVDHDDLLAPEALELMLDKHREGFDAVYSDSDKIDDSGTRFEPFHKPDWAPEYFRSVMYVGHLLSFKTQLAQDIGAFRSDFDGIQDYEFFLRFSEASRHIGHIPKILYHWRATAGSVAASPDAKGDVGKLQVKAVQEQLERLQLKATAEPGRFPHRVRVRPGNRSSFPCISILIPTKDSPEVLTTCLHSLFSKTTYPNYEVICIDNETSDAKALAELRMAPISRVIFSGKFNFSKANNFGAGFASGDYFLFMNNDVEVLSPEWLEEMLYYAEQPDVGAVGSLLVYPNGTVQHAGVVLGCRGTADHVLRNVPSDCDGYAGSLSCPREVSGVTGACLMMRRSVFAEVGGFNEHFFTAYQDVDLCLKVRERGMRIIITPHARLIHHESLSRGQYYDFVDRNLLLDYWEPLIRIGDPYYNSNFDVQLCDYSLKH